MTQAQTASDMERLCEYNKIEANKARNNGMYVLLVLMPG